MATRADWHIPEISLADDDPFAEVERIESERIQEAEEVAARIEEVGTLFDLTKDTAELQREVRSLLASEGRLHERGVQCAIKDRDDTCCSVCPLSKHDNLESDLAPLCRIGREQERILTLLAVQRDGGNH